MASKLSPATPRAKLQRGSGFEADRISPASKTGASIFGANSPKATPDRRSLRPLSTEKKTPVSRGAELHQVQEELAKTKEQLALVEKSKSNVLQDLARSKRQLDDLHLKLQDANEISKKDRFRAEEMEHATFKASEDWQAELAAMRQQYEASVIELQTHKQAMESLKHELIICVEAKDEAVRLAVEAMNAAESTAKRVEELSAELIAAKGSITLAVPASPTIDVLTSDLSPRDRKGFAVSTACHDKSTMEFADLLAEKETELKRAVEEACIARSEIGRLKEEVVLAQKPDVQLTDGTFALELIQPELAAVKQAEKEYRSQIADLVSVLDQLKAEVTEAKLVETKSNSQLVYMSSELEQLRLELAAAKEAKENALVAVNEANINSGGLRANAHNTKESEPMVLASLALVSAELEGVQENLVTVTMERATLTIFLESLKADLERSQACLVSVQENEVKANMKAEALNLELRKLVEANQTERMLLNEQVSSASAAMESLKTDVERQRLELVDITQKESFANNNVISLTKKLEQAQNEVAELKLGELRASEKGILLTKQLDMNFKEISEMKERELSMTSKVASLLEELEDEKLKVSHLENIVGISESNTAVLTCDLESMQAEIMELKERESVMGSKATVLSILLASLTKTSERKLNELKERKAIVYAEVNNLNAELTKTKQDLEEAVTVGIVAREDADKLQMSLQVATAEVDRVRQEKQEIIMEAEQHKGDAGVAQAKAQSAKDEARRALEAVHVAELEAQKRAQEVKLLKEDLQKAQEEGNLKEGEISMMRDKLEAATAELQGLRKEQDQVKQEARSLREEVDALQSCISMEKEKTVSAKDEAQAAIKDVEKYKGDLDKLKLEEDKALSACKLAENRLQDALKELDALKGDAANMQHKPSQPTGFLEIEDTCATVSQEELEILKVKLQDAEERLAIALMEVKNSHSNTENLLKELEAMKVEKDANEKALLEVHQHLADTETAKSNMEAEIQRLLDDSKQWQTAKDAIDIPIHPETLGHIYSLECRDEKPQPDLPEEIMNFTMPVLNRGTAGQKEFIEGDERVVKDELTLREDFACLSLKREDGIPKDGAVALEELASLSAKKKKKTLLVRLGTLLEKKKHSSQQAP